MKEKMLYFILGAAAGSIVTWIYSESKAKREAANTAMALKEIQETADARVERAVSKMLYIADLADYDIVDLDDIYAPTEMSAENAELNREYAELVSTYHPEQFEEGEMLAALEHPRDSEDEESMPEYQEDVKFVDALDKGEKEANERAEKFATNSFRPPFPINVDVFDEGKEEGFDEINLTYFELDNTLIDESETPVSIQETIGSVALGTHWGFGDFPKDICVVRNEKKHVDYVVTRLIAEYRGTYYPDREGNILDDQNRIIPEGENDERDE